MTDFVTDSERPTVPTSFWIIAGLGLLWNLMGAFQYYVEYNYWTKPDTRSALPPEFGALYDATPSWLYVIFAISVLAGLIGCIGLLMKKKWAVQVLLVSFVCVLVQMLFNLLGTELLSALGGSAAIMPIVVMLIAALLYFYSKRALGRGWLN